MFHPDEPSQSRRPGQGLLLACALIGACVAAPPERSRSHHRDPEAPALPSVASGQADWLDRPDPLTGEPTTAPTAGPLPPLPSPGPPLCVGQGGVDFEDVAACAGLGSALHVLVAGDSGLASGYATGQAWVDLDGDDWLDLVTTSPNGWNRIFLGTSNGGFTEWTGTGIWGVEGLGAAVGDIDNDGDRDLFIGGSSGDALFENNGADLVQIAGPTDGFPTYGASLADVDGDGTLEIWTGSHSCSGCVPNGDPCTLAGDNLWQQTASGWEARLSDALGADATLACGPAFVGVWADFDSDGDLDLYVGNDRGRDVADNPNNPTYRNTYFRNDGPGCGLACLVEDARNNGSVAFLDAMGIDVGDYDNDGDLDLAITDSDPTKILRNNGGSFEEVSVALGITGEPNTFRWGVLWLDYDNDGDLDLYTASNEQDTLFENDGGVFVDVTMAAIGVEDAHTRGAAAVDYDRDGHIDIGLGVNGGNFRLMRNTRTDTHHWLGLRLVGSTGPGGTDAIGARAWVTDTSGRVQLREVKSGSSNSAGSDLGLHFGLGDEDLVEVRIVWPDGVEQLVDVNQDAWTVVPR